MPPRHQAQIRRHGNLRGRNRIPLSARATEIEAPGGPKSRPDTAALTWTQQTKHRTESEMFKTRTRAHAHTHTHAHCHPNRPHRLRRLGPCGRHTLGAGATGETARREELWGCATAQPFTLQCCGAPRRPLWGVYQHPTRRRADWPGTNTAVICSAVLYEDEPTTEIRTIYGTLTCPHFVPTVLCCSRA